MKLKGLLAVATMALSISAMMGCKGKVSAEDVAPEENPDTAPVVEHPAPAAKQGTEHAAAEHGAATPGIEHDAYLGFGLRTYTAPIAPPALRTEVIGVSPGANYVWAPGYWRWSGAQYSWYGGRYIIRRPGYSWYAPRWGYYGGRYHYYRGYWRRF